MKTCIMDLIGTDPRSNSGLLTGFDFPDWSSDTQYVLQDASVTLRKVAFTLGSARNVDTSYSGSDVIRMMASDCVRWLMRPSTAVFAWICDKPSFVTVAKVPEQRSRDKSASEDEQLADLAMDEFFSEPLELSTNAPGGAWSAVLNCRATRQVFVRFICRNFFISLPDVVTNNRAVILDYENEEGETESFRYTRDRATRIEPSNNIGEFDVSAYFWVNYLSNTIGPAKSCLLTIDTDLMMNSLLYAAKTGRSDLYVYLQGKRADTSLWIDSSAVVASLHPKVPGSTPMESMRGIVNASILAGSDFTKGFSGLGHKTIWKTLLSYGGTSEVPSDTDLIREAHANGRSSKRSRGVDWRTHLVTERARAQFTLEYWIAHLDGKGDVHVCPFTPQGDAADAGWRRDEALTIVEC